MASDEPALPRRQFIQTTGLLTGLLAAGSPLALIAPSRAWALELHALTSEQGAAVMAAARTIAPHDKLEDAAYTVVVGAVDTAAKDPAVLDMLRHGLSQLGAGFATAPEATRVVALRAVEPTPFFEFLRSQTLGTLYSTPLAYAHFGYQGEAFSKGGYLFRGFNDLHWLPDVPLEDSGPMPRQG